MALGEAGKQKLYPFRAGGAEKWKSGMMELFPDEEAALDKYLHLLAVRELMFNIQQLTLKSIPTKFRFCLHFSFDALR